MSRRRYVEELEYTPARGLDTTSVTSQMAQGFVRRALNCNLGVTSGYFKREGYTSSLTTDFASLSIRQGLEYIQADGTSFKLFYGTDDVFDGRLGRQNVGGGVDDILLTLSTTDRLAMVQFEDRVYGFNGDSVSAPFVYDGGAAVRDLGLAAPATLTGSAAVTDVSGELGDGSYIVAYTYVLKDNASGRVLAESSPSPFETVVVASPDNAIDMPVTASTATALASETIFIRTYRTLQGGLILLKAAEFSNTTATVRLLDSNATITANVIQLAEDNNQLDTFLGYDQAKFPTVARNRLFVANKSKNEVRWSKIGQEGPLPESFSAVAFAAVEGRQGSADKIVGISQIKGVPLILKERSIGRLEEVGLPEVTRSEDPVTYIYREISDSVGAITHFAAAQVIDELVFLSRDNIYATTGGTVRPIANSIQSTIRALDFRNAKTDNISAINDTKNRRLYISVFSNTAATEPNLVIVGDYQAYPEFRWTTYEEGTNTVTHPGIRAGSFFQLVNPADGSLDVHFGNTDGNGKYYKMNDGRADDGKGIFFKIVSRPYEMEQPLVTKLFKNTRIFVQAESDSYDLEFCAIFDLGTNEEPCQVFNISNLGGKWDEHKWAPSSDPLIWAGSGFDELQYDPHRKAKFMQLVFNQPDADAPVTLLGWGVSGSIFGGR